MSTILSVGISGSFTTSRGSHICFSVNMQSAL
jgi:hypothetical protein